MTRRITISLPDDVAEYVQKTGSNSSGFIASILRRKMYADGLRAEWATAGHVVTDDDVERTRRRLGDLAPITDEQHRRNLEWLGQFDHDRSAAV